MRVVVVFLLCQFVSFSHYLLCIWTADSDLYFDQVSEEKAVELARENQKLKEENQHFRLDFVFGT